MISVLQVNSGDLMGRRFNGFDLTPRLLEFNVESRHLVFWNHESKEEFVRKLFPYPGSRHLTRVVNAMERECSVHARYHPHSWMLPLHEEFRSADVVHYHIIHDGFFSLSALPFLSKLRPTVWTWHDPWPMTGHCIYPMDCNRWQIGCGSCPDLDRPFPMRNDRTAQQFKWKADIFPRIKGEIIVASNWMYEMAMKSPLSRAFDFTVIPFGLDLDTYAPRDKSAARERLGVLQGRKVICTRTSSTPYKGLSDFVAALDLVDSAENLCIIGFQELGHFDKFIGRHQIIEFGWTNDEELLRDALAACDFFMMPSKAEAFGLMAIEAMACGRAVISYEGTSLPSITFAPEVGISVEKGNIRELASAIAHLLNNPEDCDARGRRSREIAEHHYDIRRQARDTSNLYNRVAGRQRQLANQRKRT